MFESASRLIPAPPLMKIIILLLGLMLLVPARATTPFDTKLMSRLSDIIRECSKLKPGTPRAELMKNFMLDGGIYDPWNCTFDYLPSPNIKVDVTFKRADPKEKKESPLDTIRTISKPYLAPFLRYAN
jgi:hypothetical protein